MSDHIHLEKGHHPWLPSSSAKLLETFHLFTVPLVGLIGQHGCEYIFWCVVGHAGPENAWAYARVDDSFDLELLRQATNENFATALATVVRGKASVFAIASDEDGIAEWVAVDPPASFEDVHERGMAELGAKVNETMAEMQHLMEQYPAIRAVSRFSISPSPQKALV